MEDVTTNLGAMTSPETVIHYYISATTPVTRNNMRLLGSRRVNPLFSTESSRVGEELGYFTVPDGLPDGLLYMTACVDPDEHIDELDEGNNCLWDPEGAEAVLPRVPGYCRSDGNVLSRYTFRESRYQATREQTNTYLAHALYFIEQDDPRCVLKRLDVKNAGISPIMALKECPKDIYVRSRESLILAHADGVQELRLGATPHLTPRIPFPTTKVKEGNYPLELDTAMFSAKGEWLLVMTSWYPWDDQDKYIFRRENEKWIQESLTLCKKWATKCAYPDLREHWGVDFQRAWAPMPWDGRQRGNPHLRVVRSKASEEGGELAITEFNFEFEFGEVRSTVRILTRRYAHSDGVSPFRVFIRTGEAKEEEIAYVQSYTSLMGPYFYISRLFREGNDVYDLRTGRSIARPKIRAWMY